MSKLRIGNKAKDALNQLKKCLESLEGIKNNHEETKKRGTKTVQGTKRN